MTSSDINQHYGIPRSFYEVIKPYIVDKPRRVAETPSELLTIWRAAISAYDERPDLAEVTAEWAMSAGASSPLINEPEYEDIHVRFGQAEVPADDKDEQWTQDEVNAVTGLIRLGKVELHFASENLIVHRDSPSNDKLRLGIGLVLAEHYSASISDNVRQRFDDLRHYGNWPHQAPPGYLNSRIDERNTTLVVDPDRRHYIIRAFELRAEGVAYDEIAKMLFEEGFIRRSGRKFTTKDIALITDNPFYFGRMRIKGIEYDHRYEPIITRSLYDRCQAVKRRRAHNPSKYNSREFATKGLATCARCGHSASPTFRRMCY